MPLTGKCNIIHSSALVEGFEKVISKSENPQLFTQVGIVLEGGVHSWLALKNSQVTVSDTPLQTSIKEVRDKTKQNAPEKRTC
jgi:hypothetical protein